MDPSSRRHNFIACSYAVKLLFAGHSQWYECLYVLNGGLNNLMETKSFQEYWVNRISIWLGLTVLTGGWKVETLFSQGVIRAHLVLVLSHFSKTILVWAEPLSHRNSLFRSLWVSPHLCLPGLNSGFCKYLSTSGTEVKLSWGICRCSCGEGFQEVLIPY